MTFGVPVQFYAVLKVDAPDSTEAVKVAVDELNKADVCVVRRPAGTFEHSERDERFRRSVLAPRPFEAFCNEGIG